MKKEFRRTLFSEYHELRNEVVGDDDYDLSDHLDRQAVDVKDVDSEEDDPLFQQEGHEPSADEGQELLRQAFRVFRLLFEDEELVGDVGEQDRDDVGRDVRNGLRHLHHGVEEPEGDHRDEEGTASEEEIGDLFFVFL